MVSAKQWRQRRIEKFNAPSGDQYLLRIPDPLTLIDAWRNAGVKTPLDEKDLGEKVSQRDVIAHILMQFILEPKITLKPTETSLGINELMDDQTDAIAIYRQILRLFLEGGDELAQFFRNLIPGPQSRHRGSLLSQVANRPAKTNLSGPSREDSMEPADSKSDPKMATRTGHRRRGPRSKKGED